MDLPAKPTKQKNEVIENSLRLNTRGSPAPFAEAV